MSKQSIEVEGNKLIAEFHGWKHVETPKKKGKGYWEFPEWGKAAFDIRFMKYHSSFDWLMPACRKFDLLDTSEFTEDQMKLYMAHSYNIDMAVTRYEIIPAFTELVNALHWYNQNKQS